MKKIVPILLAVALALALCLVGFADAERYDDDPLEETAASHVRSGPGGGRACPCQEQRVRRLWKNVLRNHKRRYF